MNIKVYSNITVNNIEYDYDIVRNCTEHGCDTICRCSVIESWEVTGFNHNISYSDFDIKEFNINSKGRYKNKKLSEIEKYCINELIKHFGGHDTSNFELVTSNGYYGEEVDGVEFANLNILKNNIVEMLTLDKDIDKIFFILKKEYSHIADIIKNCTNVGIKEIPLANITASSGMALLKRQDSYLCNIDYDLPIGIIRNNVIIDGNHRFSYSIDSIDKVDKAKYIVLS